MPVTADNRVLEVNTKRLRPFQALETLYDIVSERRKNAEKISRIRY